ncbi:MAG: VanZ family protein [Bacteroidales bacterium]|nr:VanZ family protein [Bacteroidales bacterium]
MKSIWRFPLTVLTVIVIWILSLMPVKELHLENVDLSDKTAHFLMYGGLSLVACLEYLFYRKRHEDFASRSKLGLNLLLRGLILPALMGGLLEVLQAYCTNGNRSGEVLDAVANCIGATLGYVLSLVSLKILKFK